jgi:catechol 2,3-dioxygenase-like lactoylglutathione lyase family enzyme
MLRSWEVVWMFDSATTHATIAVKDIEQAKKFYGGTLGLQAMDERSDGIRYRDGGGGWFLVYPSQFAGTAQSTYMSFEVDDVEKVVDELRGRGIVFEEYDFPGLKTVNGIADSQGFKGAWFKDPDGNILAIGEPT